MTEKHKKFFQLRLAIFLLYFLMPPIILIFIYEPTLLSFVSLEKIIIKSGISKDIVVIRDNNVFNTEEGMELEPGDKIINKGDGKIEITIRAIQLTTDNGIILKRARVMFNRNTEVTLQHTSLKQKPYGFISLEKGDIYIETDRYPFNVETTYITAGTKGTKFLVRLEAGDRVTVVVSEGVILLESKAKKWKARELQSPGKSVIIGEKPPAEEVISVYHIDKELEWIRDVQKNATSTELLWDYPLTGLLCDWYIRVKLNSLFKKQEVYRTFNDRYTADLFELDFDPGLMSVKFTAAGANYFEAEVTYSKVQGYIWTVNSDGDIKFFKDPDYNFPENKISLISIVLFTALFVLIGKFIRYRLKSGR